MLKAHKRIYEASLARIFDIDGIRPIAAALFINEKYLLTPAHVIYQRVHKKKISFDYDYRGKLKEKDFINVRVLGQKIPVDFPFKDNNQRFEAEVVPKSLNFDNNVIILKLKDTSSFNNEIVPLSFDDNLTGHLFSSYPFSMPNIDKKDERYKDKIDERWVTDKVMSYTSDGLFRLGGAIKLDYLGSSVWDEDLEKFIGIIINGKLDEIGLPVETYMLPFSKIENYLLDSLSSPTELEKPIVYPPVPVVGRGSPIVLQRVSEILSEDRKPCLNADKYAEALANTLNGARGEICFAVFGHWGRGKTYLMQKVARILSQGDYECVEFSAWKYRVKPELWIYLYETLRKKALMIENTYELDANKNNFIKTITRTIFPFLRKIKIYLVKHGLWKGVFFPIVIALPLLGGIPLGLT
ncbi:MAG: P-loop NTPase fold protein, partial [Xenococcus sp. (in: cyanobacteria)]